MSIEWVVNSIIKSYPTNEIFNLLKLTYKNMLKLQYSRESLSNYVFDTLLETTE